jgi:hypothetical protein
VYSRTVGEGLSCLVMLESVGGLLLSATFLRVALMDRFSRYLELVSFAGGEVLMLTEGGELVGCRMGLSLGRVVCFCRSRSR